MSMQALFDDLGIPGSGGDDGQDPEKKFLRHGAAPFPSKRWFGLPAGDPSAVQAYVSLHASRPSAAANRPPTTAESVAAFQDMLR